MVITLSLSMAYVRCAAYVQLGLSSCSDTAALTQVRMWLWHIAWQLGT